MLRMPSALIGPAEWTLQHILDALHLEVGRQLLEPARRHQDQLAHRVGIIERVLDRDRAAERIAQRDASADPDRVEKAAQGLDEKIERVGHVLRLGGQAVAGQVGHDRANALLGEKRIVALEVAVTARARTRAVDEHDRIAAGSGFVVMDVVALGRASVFAYGNRGAIAHVTIRVVNLICDRRNAASPDASSVQTIALNGKESDTPVATRERAAAKTTQYFCCDRSIDS